MNIENLGSYLKFIEQAKFKLSHISYSKLKTLECPLKFTLRYIYTYPYEPPEFFKIGREVHRIIELFLKKVKSIDESLELENLLLNGEYQKEISKGKIISNLNFLEKLQEKLLTKGYEAYLEHEEKIEINEIDVKLYGIFDAMYINHKKKKILVIDHKTSKVARTSPYLIQAICYKKILEKLYPDFEILLAFNFIREEESLYFVEKLDTSQLSNYIKRLKNTYFDNPFGKKETYLCKYCEYRDICQKINTNYSFYENDLIIKSSIEKLIEEEIKLCV